MRKEVKILGLSYSQTQVGSYVIVLSEIKGKVKLPIIIKPNDAQQITLKIENIKTPRPLTHDSFKSITDFFNIDIQEVYIYSILEGVFYAKLLSSNGLDDIEIECTVGDAIIISLTYECPIYVSDDILKSSGIYMSDNGAILSDEEIKKEEEILEIKNKKTKKRKSERIVSLNDLKKMMEEAVANEEYEIAAEIKERIENLSKNK
jgi:uncharacterized protein